MELTEIRKREIKYCESLSGLTDKEKEIAYKAYVSALSNEENFEKCDVRKITTEISYVSNIISSCENERMKYSSCNTPLSC